MLGNFTPPGPVGASFMKSRAPVKFIMGPVGSGKTSCMVMDTIHIAAEQPRSRIDGVRYSKALFVRDTFRQLEGTTIPSWWTWMPKATGKWTGGVGGGVSEHHLQFQLPDQSVVDLVVMFEALGERNVEDLFRGKEFNIMRLNEADTIAPEVLSQGLIRVQQGRYPGARHVEPSRALWSVAGDYNAPDIENYLYKLKEENKPAGWEFFRQPGGRDADAENMAHNGGLPAYESMAASLIGQGRPDLVRRMVDNQYGFTRDGKPVYMEYRDDFHCAGEELLPAAGLAVKVDFDQGLHPACLLRQTMPNGQMRVLDELYSDAGATGLCEALKRLAGSEKYSRCRLVGGRVDPSANARDANDAESWVDCVNRLMGWRGAQMVRVADTNEPDKRQAAVRFRLMKNVDDGRPGLLISTTCRMLRKGFNSEYRYKKVRGSGSDSYQESPEKKFPVSDVHDALQYGALDDGGFEEVVGRAAREKRPFGGKTFQAKMAVRL
jgi:hypothetical protein